jgi:hypothetical protein
MWLSRTWVVLLAVVAAALLAAALTAPGPGSRDMVKAHGYKLDLIQHNAQLLLKLDARHAIDAAASLVRDARIVDALAQAGVARQRDLKALQAKANAAMLDLLSHFGDEDRPELFIVVDSRGKQLARVGPGENAFEPGQRGLSGFPLVEAALRGYLRDDTWSINGRLYIMAAAPVLSRNSARYLGALLIGQEVTPSFAKQIKGRLVAVHEASSAKPDEAFLARTDVAFFLRGKMVASTVDFEALRKLPLQYSKRRDKLLKAGRSVALRIGQDAAKHMVVMAPLSGEAFSHDAFYAVLTQAPSATGLWAALGRAHAGDLGVAGIIKVLGTLLALLIVGLLVLHLQIDVPYGRLLDDLRRLSRGDLSRLPQRTYPYQQASLAQMVNEAVERVSVRRPPSPPAKSPNDSGAVQHLGSPPGLSLGSERDLDPPPRSAPPHSGTFDTSGVDFRPAHGGAMPPLAQAAEPLPPLGSTQPPLTSAQPPELALDEGLEDPTSPQSAPLAPLTPMTALPSVPEPPVVSSVPAMGDGAGAAGFAADLPLLKPVDLPAQTEDSDTVGNGLVASEWSDLAASARPQPLAPLEPMAPARDAPAPDQEPVSSAPLQRSQSAEESETVMSSVPEHLARSLEEEVAPDRADVGSLDALGAHDEEDDHFRQIYHEFVAIKRSCGESTDKLTYDRFVAKLRKNSQALMGKYNCQGVRFKVYVKDGKAALKATPVQS